MLDAWKSRLIKTGDGTSSGTGTIMGRSSPIPTATDAITGPTPGINGAMALGVVMVTGTNTATEPPVARGPTIPVTDIIVSSFGNAAVLQGALTGCCFGKVEGWSGTAGGRIIIRDTAPCMRGLARRESTKPRH